MHWYGLPIASFFVVSLLLSSSAAEAPPASDEVKESTRQERPTGKAPSKTMTRSEVDAHNADVLGTLNADLPARDFSWTYIVVHHTASEWSSLERIDRYHRDKFEDPDGIEYHFLIGNGKKRPSGYIEPARWRIQKRAIHLFKPEGAPQAIAISLVGNLHERQIKDTQYDALLELVSQLMLDHDIPLSHVTTHTGVDGNLTVCPGKHFPYTRLLDDLKARVPSRSGSTAPP